MNKISGLCTCTTANQVSKSFSESRVSFPYAFFLNCSICKLNLEKIKNRPTHVKDCKISLICVAKLIAFRSKLTSSKYPGAKL